MDMYHKYTQRGIITNIQWELANVCGVGMAEQLDRWLIFAQSSVDAPSDPCYYSPVQ